MKVKIKKLTKKIDRRGFLVEILKASEIKKKKFGQIFLTVAKKGQTKGGHFHKRKTEWYCVILGKAKILLKDLKTKESKEVLVSEKELQLVEISPFVFHSIKNIGDNQMHLLVYIDEEFNADDPDTFASE